MIKQHDALIEPIAKEMLRLSKLAEAHDKRASKYLEEIDKALIAEEKICHFYEMGYEYRSKHKYFESIKAFKKAVKYDYFYSGYIDIAITYRWMNQYKRTLYYSNKTMEIIIRYACRKVLKNRQHLNKLNRLTEGDLAKLILDIKKAAVAEPTYGVACGLIAWCYERMGELEKAKKLKKEERKSNKKFFKPFEHLWAREGAS